MDEKKRNRIYNTILNYNKKYLSDPSLDNRLQTLKKTIKKHINQNDLKSIKTCLGYYRALSHWHAEKAQSALLAGDSSAWDEINLAFNYRYYDMRFDPCVTPVDMGSVLLLHALAKRDKQKTNWLFEYQLNSFRTNKPNTWDLSQAGIFSFMLLHKLGDNRFDPLELKKYKHSPSMEAFSDIINHWDNPQKVGAGISIACDYHLQQSQNGEGYPEYQIAPYFVVPIEIMALMSVREQLGLPTVLPKHIMINDAVFSTLSQFYSSSCLYDNTYNMLLEQARAIIPEL